MDCHDIPLTQIDWKSAVRIISSRFPPVGLFDDVADPADLDAVYAIEDLTNPRLREEAGEISLVPAGDLISGPGTTPIMAAFTHLYPNGSRFSDGSFGIYYAAKDLATAIKETIYHRERLLRWSHEEPIEVDQRVYYADINSDMHDIRTLRADCREWYDQESYSASQPLGLELKKSGSNGLVYFSVRDPDGECVAVFRPCLISPVTQGPHLTYVWDGKNIVDYYEKRELVL